jgi:hypothetical protein
MADANTIRTEAIEFNPGVRKETKEDLCNLLRLLHQRLDTLEKNTKYSFNTVEREGGW